MWTWTPTLIGSNVRTAFGPGSHWYSNVGWFPWRCITFEYARGKLSLMVQSRRWDAIALVIAKNISVRSKIMQTNMREVNSFLSQNRVSFLSKHQTCNPLDNLYGNNGEVCHRRDWEWRRGKIYFCEKHSRLSIKRTLPWSGHFNEADTSIKRILSFGL